MRELLLESFRAAVAAADPRAVVPARLPPPPAGRTLVVGAGKAAAAMAVAVEAAWPRDAPMDGLVLTRYGHGLPTSRIAVREAGHPLPDAEGVRGALELLSRVRALGPDDLLLALWSGGGSALLGVPVEGVPLADLKAVTGALLRCGAPIEEINVVRKHLTQTLGGQIAAQCAAPAVTLIVSDVTGDAPTHIASGPTAPDPSTYGDALATLWLYAVEMPESVRRRLEDGAAGRVAETPKPGDPCFARVQNHVIARAGDALAAAAAFFRTHGITPVIVDEALRGEASAAGDLMARMVKRVVREGRPLPPPVALLSGGETTVTVRPNAGKGGRCTEFLLAFAAALGRSPDVHALAADTDGIDGTEDNAGALLTPTALSRAEALGLDARQLLRTNDSYTFFAALGDLVMTGPTRTNVNEYRAILVARP